MAGLARLALLSAGLCLSAATVQAAPEITTAGLNLTSTETITAIAEDGQRYSKLETSDLTFAGHVGAKVKRGYITGYGVFSGVCAGALCGTAAFKELHSEYFAGVRLLSKSASFTFSTDKFPQGLSNNVQASRIFRKCNTRAKNGTQSTTPFVHSVRVTLRLQMAQYRTSNVTFWYFDKDVSVPVTVKCQRTSNNILPTKPIDVNVSARSLDGGCLQRTEVRAIIDFAEPKTAVFRFRHNGKLSEAIRIKARKLKLGGRVLYRIERIKYYTLGPGAHRFRVEVRGGGKSDIVIRGVKCAPFAASAMWLTLDQQNKAACPKNVRAKVRITANRPGSILTKIKNQAGVVMAIESVKIKRKGEQFVGILHKTFNMREIDTMLIAEDSNNANLNSSWQPLKVTCLEPVKGTVSFQDPRSPSCSRAAKVAMAIRTTTPGKIRFRLQCSGNRRWSGRLNAQQTGPNTYLGVGVKTLKITKDEQINCALHTVVNGRSKLQTLQGYKFQCIDQTPTPTDLGVPPRPTHDEPKPVPPSLVTPVPPSTIVECAPGFRKVRGRCLRITCPRGETLVGNRCIRQVVCSVGFKKVGRRCVPITCPPRETLVGNRCIRRVVCSVGFKKVGQRCVRIACPRGQTLVGGRCIRRVVCSRGFKKVGQRCVRIACPRGQTLVGGRCIRRVVCSRGFKKVGQRCVRIACPRGQILVGGRCIRRVVCRQGFRKVGQRCVRAEKVCPTGYRKIRGRCIRPAARQLNIPRRTNPKRRVRTR